MKKNIFKGSKRMWCFKNVIFGVILALFSCQVDSSEQIVGNKPEVSEEGSGWN